MIIQRTSGSDGKAILERTVRLLIYASFRLCAEPLRLYDPRINDTHLQESLSWLMQCYATESGPHSNQEEFQALSLLYNLGVCVCVCACVCVVLVFPSHKRYDLLLGYDLLLELVYTLSHLAF